MNESAAQIARRQAAFEAGYDDGSAAHRRLANYPTSQFTVHATQSDDYLEGWKAGVRDAAAGLIEREPYRG